MPDDEEWKMQCAINTVSMMTVDEFQTTCENYNIAAWEIDHMVYDLAKALTVTRSRPNGK